MNEIEIKYNPNADTRTMTSLPTEKELFKYRANAKGEFAI